MDLYFWFFKVVFIIINDYLLYICVCFDLCWEIGENCFVFYEFFVLSCVWIVVIRCLLVLCIVLLLDINFNVEFVIGINSY